MHCRVMRVTRPRRFDLMIGAIFWSSLLLLFMRMKTIGQTAALSLNAMLWTSVLVLQTPLNLL